MIATASVATAAPAKMTWSMSPTETTVPSGGTISYAVNIECSNVDPESCETPTVTVNAPSSADGQTVATEPTVDGSGVAVTTNADGAAVVAFDTMEPGTSRQVLLTWSIPNFTVLPDTELTTDGTLTYTPGEGTEVTGVEPTGDIDSVTTTADPAITVTKAIVNPDSADKVRAGDTVVYRLTVCLPGDRLGQLDYTNVKLVDTLEIDPVEPDGAKAVFADVDGGTVSADGRSVTWDIPLTADERPLCGTDASIIKEVEVHYPLGMQPSATGGQVANRTIVNNLDAEATLITGDVLTGHDEMTHVLTSSADTGGNHLQPYQNTTQPTDPIVKGEDTEFRWRDNLNWRVARQSEGNDLRATAIFDSIACMDNVVADVPTSLPLNQSGVNEANELHGLFAPTGSYTAPTLPQQCADPAFTTNTVVVNIPGAGALQDEFRVTVYAVDPATGATTTSTVTLNNVAASSSREIPVYDASGFNLASNFIVTDVLGVSSPQLASESYFQIHLLGTQSESFKASDYMSMANHFISYLSSVSSDGTLATVEADATEHARPNSQARSFVRSLVIPEITKSSDDDLTVLKPGDEVTWNLTAGNSDSSEDSLKPTVYDVLPVGLEYVPGSATWDLQGHAAPTENVETVTIDGQERQKVTWTFSENFAPGETVSVSFKTTVTLDAVPGSHANADAQYSAILDQNGEFTEGLNAEDTWDIDGDGNTDERVQISTVAWTVTAESGATIEKFVKGSAGDGQWKVEDVSIAALEDDDTDATSGTDVDYRISVTNTASNTLTNVVIYDVLPYVGDTAISESIADQQRESEFQVDFAKLLGDLPDGVTVQYSQSNDPTRDELSLGGTGTLGAADDWSSDVPADPSTVRALRFVIDELAPSQNVQLDYRGVVPTFEWNNSEQVCLADPAKKAWNNVGFQATAQFADGSSRALLPAEAPKVSIREVCGLIGDYAWFDENHDGVQDDDELPAPGVVFQLVDADGNDVVDADGNPVTTTTDENGFYSFDVPVGDWAVKVVEVPPGYDITTPNAGGDDAADSDVPSLNVPTATVSITPDHLEDLTLDAGLVGKVTVGDYVWFDTDKDGIQDEGEPGIADVWMEIVGPDGQPVTDVWGNPVEPVQTDADGKYIFENLPVLDDGQSYTVRIDREASIDVLGPLAPTTSGAGDRDVDSSDWEAASQGLTNPGEEDLTLDFGFVPTTPTIDIEKYDSNGNDADTAEEAVQLPEGNADLEFTVTNLGDEDLVDIAVTDELLEGTGSISDLVCVFPDESTGTEWAGPFIVGDSFDCSATLTGVEPGTDHVDNAKVTGTARYSGVPVEDEDPYHGHTPKPAIDIEKVDLDGNDADKPSEAVNVNSSERDIKLIVTNTGDEPLRDVRLGDVVTDGAATVDDLVCTFPDGSKGVTWAGEFAVADVFECSATINGLVAGDLHADNSTVTGVGVYSGKTVTDSDPYHAVRTPALPTTGSSIGWISAMVALVMVGAGGVAVASGRRGRESEETSVL